MIEIANVDVDAYRLKSCPFVKRRVGLTGESGPAIELETTATKRRIPVKEHSRPHLFEMKHLRPRSEARHAACVSLPATESKNRKHQATSWIGCITGHRGHSRCAAALGDSVYDQPAGISSVACEGRRPQSVRRCPDLVY